MNHPVVDIVGAATENPTSAARPVGRHDGADGEGGVSQVASVPRLRGGAQSALVELGGGGPDPHDHPEVEEDEKEEWEGARRADVLPVTAELDVRGVLKKTSC